MDDLRAIEFRGDSLSALKRFPESARRRAGRELQLVQIGRDPMDWKPMSTIGPGVREIRIRDEKGIFRVVYVTRFADAIFVLHCFQKKTQATSRADIVLATRRYKEILRSNRDE